MSDSSRFVLLERLSRLEQVVQPAARTSGSGGEDRSSSVTARVLRIHQELTELEARIDGYKEHRKLHKAVAPTLRLAEDGAAPPLSVDAKAELALASEDHLLRSMATLEEIAALESTVSAPFLSDLPAVLDRMEKLELARSANRAAAAACRRERDVLLSAYDAVVSAASEKCLRWDAMCTSWDTALQRREQKTS